MVCCCYSNACSLCEDLGVLGYTCSEDTALPLISSLIQCGDEEREKRAVKINEAEVSLSLELSEVGVIGVLIYCLLPWCHILCLCFHEIQDIVFFHHRE